MKEARELSQDEILSVQSYFGKNDKINRSMNKILEWNGDK